MQKRLYCWSIGLALCAATSAMATEGMLKDPITGCGVWTDDTKVARSVSWSGACADGKASGNGILVVMAKGEFEIRFSGTMTNGKANGLGLVHYRTSGGFASYAGEFADSKLHGRGMSVHPDGAHYEGQFIDDEPQGFGTHTAVDGARYQGEFSKGKPVGMGSYTAPNGDVYLGNFANSKPEGEMILIRKDGSRERQTWKNGEMVK